MLLLDLTLDSPAENLALDEALLLAAESDAPWRTKSATALGAAAIHDRARLPSSGACSRKCGWRTSGSGGSKFSGGIQRRGGRDGGAGLLDVCPGARPKATRRAAGHRHDAPLRARSARSCVHAPLMPGVACRGTSDLAVGARKFSGNSLQSNATGSSITARCSTIFRCRS